MKKYIIVVVSLVMMILFVYYRSTPFADQKTTNPEEESVELIWYQVGEEPKDLQLVEDAVNEYTKEKIGVTVDIRIVGWNEYNERMKRISNSGQDYDLVFTSEWINDYVGNVQIGEFFPLNDLLQQYGQDVLATVDDMFWEGAEVNGTIYGIPTQKEAVHMPMWIFKEEYISKYDIPFEDIIEIQDLEPYLQLIKSKESGVVPLHLSQGFEIPSYYDEIVPGVGYDLRSRKVEIVKVYETDDMMQNFQTVHGYYQRGYINQDAPILTGERQEVDRFVTKGDGQPYAEHIWSRELGYEVIARNAVQSFSVTNQSIRGALTAISAQTDHPKEAMQFLNLLHTDPYLINLLVYGIEDIHYEMVDDTVIRFTEESSDYKVANYVQGNLFLAYTVEGEPDNKWEAFEEINSRAYQSPLLGFDFDPLYVEQEVADIKRIIDVFSTGLHTGVVDPTVYLPKLNDMLAIAGIDKVETEVQRQVDNFLAQK